MRKFLFILIQIILLPIGFTSYIFVVAYCLIKAKKYNNISITALTPLSARYILHELNFREDPIAKLILENMPTVYMPAVKTCYFPLVLGMKITGYVPSLLKYSSDNNESPLAFVNSRTEFFDRVFLENILEVSQVVIMGAGFDTRAFKFSYNPQVHFFEIDLSNTQKFKRDILKKFQIPTEQISFIPVDFNIEDWTKKLITQGFDLSKKTIFLWEGVTLYLTEDVVRKTISEIGKIASKDSVFAFDLYGTSFVKKYDTMKAKKVMTEHVVFGINLREENFEALEDLIKDTGFIITEYRYIGKETSKKGYFSVDITCTKL